MEKKPEWRAIPHEPVHNRSEHKSGLVEGGLSFNERLSICRQLAALPSSPSIFRLILSHLAGTWMQADIDNYYLLLETMYHNTRHFRPTDTKVEFTSMEHDLVWFSVFGYPGRSLLLRRSLYCRSTRYYHLGQTSYCGLRRRSGTGTWH